MQYAACVPAASLPLFYSAADFLGKQPRAHMIEMIGIIKYRHIILKEIVLVIEYADVSIWLDHGLNLFIKSFYRYFLRNKAKIDFGDGEFYQHEVYILFSTQGENFSKIIGQLLVIIPVLAEM